MLIDILESSILMQFKERMIQAVVSSSAVLYLDRSKKSRIADDLLITAYGNIKYNGEKIEIPDYGLDNHTLRGKKMARDIKFFIEESSKVENYGLKTPTRKQQVEYC